MEFSGALIGEKDRPPPLDAVFLRLMHDQRVNVHLIALPRVAPGVNGGNPKGNKREADHGGGNKPQPLNRPRTGDKEPAKVPEELKGLKLRTSEKENLCAGITNRARVATIPQKLAGASLDTTHA